MRVQILDGRYTSNAPDSATLLQVDANGLVELGSSAAGVPYTVGIPYRSELHSLPYESYIPEKSSSLHYVNVRLKN